MFQESIDKKDAKSEVKNHAVRFSAYIDEEEILNIDPKKIDASFKNQLQDLNMTFSIIYRDSSSQDPNNDYVVRALSAPSFLPYQCPVWDICFFTCPYIIESNVLCRQAPKNPALYFSYYTKLSVFLKNRKALKFSELLCKLYLYLYLQNLTMKGTTAWTTPGSTQKCSLGRQWRTFLKIKTRERASCGAESSRRCFKGLRWARQMPKRLQTSRMKQQSFTRCSLRA